MTTTTDPSTTADQERLARIRVPLRTPTGIFGRLVVWYSKRSFGDLADPAYVMGHHPDVLKATTSFERKVAKWHELDADLKNLAQVASAAAIGCSWCLDFGYFMANSKGESVEKLRAAAHWRDAEEVFTDDERAVLGYADAMTATPPTVTDAMVADLVTRLGTPAVVELTKMVAVENERSRFNHAMGLTSQGFSDRCELPPR